MELVTRQTDAALAQATVPLTLPAEVAELLVTTFHELREGVTAEGERIERPTTPMSTAEAVSVATSAGLHAHYYGESAISPDHLARHLVGTALKDDPDDLARLQGYFSRVVRRRAQDSALWSVWYEARRWLS